MKLIKYVLGGLFVKKYGYLLYTTILLLLCLKGISLLHTEILDYNLHNSPQKLLDWQVPIVQINVGYLIKWCLMLACLIIYWSKNLKKYGRQVTNNKPIPKNRQTQDSQPSQSSNTTDRFASIRTKDRLRSRGDLLLDKNKPK